MSHFQKDKGPFAIRADSGLVRFDRAVTGQAANQDLLYFSPGVFILEPLTKGLPVGHGVLIVVSRYEPINNGRETWRL